MIKQDYLLRMIQEIITLLVNALLNRQKYARKVGWSMMTLPGKYWSFLPKT